VQIGLHHTEFAAVLHFPLQSGSKGPTTRWAVQTAPRRLPIQLRPET